MLDVREDRGPKALTGQRPRGLLIFLRGNEQLRRSDLVDIARVATDVELTNVLVVRCQRLERMGCDIRHK